MRVALNDAAPLYRDAPEAREVRASGTRAVDAFLREALPTASDRTRALAGELIATTLKQVGKHYSEAPRTPEEIEVFADSLADMFCAYLGSLEQGWTGPEFRRRRAPPPDWAPGPAACGPGILPTDS